MYIAFAPLEGITTAAYRRVFRRYFTGVDKFYTPFLCANASHKFRTREKKEYLPYDDDLIPQILTASADDFLWAAGVLGDAGYTCVNLNTGCPSATVVTKGRGAGMLADKEKFDSFLYSVFASGNRIPDISVKTRIGASSHGEIYELIDIWKKYPLSEIIVHPRAGSDIYEGVPDREAFGAVYDAFKDSGTLITYNGDIRSVEDLTSLQNDFPDLSRIMIGRGLLIDPMLADKIKSSTETMTGNEKINAPAAGGAVRRDTTDAYANTLYSFTEDLWAEYEGILSGPRDILFKMKELWSWLGMSFPDNPTELKTIRKTRDTYEYKAAVKRILG